MTTTQQVSMPVPGLLGLFVMSYSIRTRRLWSRTARGQLCRGAVKELHIRLIQTTASRRHGILDNDEAHAYKSNQEGTCAERELFVVQRRLYYRLCCACHVSQPSPATANLAKVSLMQRVPSGVFRRSNHAFILRILPSRVPAGARQCRIALISRNPFPTWRAGPCGACWGGHGEASRPALSGRHETPQSWWC